MPNDSDCPSQEMLKHDFNVRQPIMDGVIHRCTVGDKKEKTGWYCFFTDGIPAGVFGDWSTDVKYQWCAKSESKMTVQERKELNRRLEIIKAIREKNQAETWAEAAIKAEKIWDSASPVKDHPYLKKKNVASYGIKYLSKSNILVIPVYGSDENIQSIQYVSADGEKKFMTDGKASGGFYFIDGDLKHIAIVEGYATGASVHQATGYAVYVGFNAGNLMAVAKIVKARHPGAHIVVCCDNDQWKPDVGNVGLNKGRAAAEAIRAFVAVPVFKNVATKPTDFNDLAMLERTSTVKKQIFSVFGPVSVTASELKGMEFANPDWIIPGILLPGLYIFAAKPKMGKSMMALNLGISVASGGMALGSIQVRNPGPVIYFSMEDNLRRLKLRIDKMCSGPWPDGLIIYEQWGGVDFVKSIIKHDTRLVIIDTLQRTRDDRNAGKQDLYQYDYKSIAPLQTLAAQNNIAILIIHHLRKSEDDDPHSCISGSLGLTGAADGTWVLKRKTGAADAVLYTQGRDFEGQELALKFHSENFMWELLGDAADIQSTGDRQSVYDAIKNACEAVSPKDVAELTGVKNATVRKIIARFLAENKITKATVGGRSKFGYYQIKS